MSCDHKFVDSRHCIKCGWAPDDADRVVPITVSAKRALESRLAESERALALAREAHRQTWEDERAAHAQTRAELADERSARDVLLEALSKTQEERDWLAAEANAEHGDLTTAQARVSELEQQRDALLDTKATHQLAQEAAESAHAAAQKQLASALRVAEQGLLAGPRTLALRTICNILSTPTPAPSEPEEKT